MYKYKIAIMRNGKRQSYGKNKISKKWKNQKIKIMAKNKNSKIGQKNNSLVWHRKMVRTIWQKLKFKNWTKIIL